ncbi:hypothetical protein FS749_016645 [Ceratobasidium sp. UAMH 11750]|nr:hypothetical protein FS749_016645 [Ceratobasidium sp. UAMH 11750]
MIFNAVLLVLVGVIAVAAYPLRQVKRDEPKVVFAHLIVGNTYNYNATHWETDIALASSKAIDAFTLNVGPDVWQPDRVRAAYDAAQKSNLGFKRMFESICCWNYAETIIPSVNFTRYDRAGLCKRRRRPTFDRRLYHADPWTPEPVPIQFENVVVNICRTMV